MSRAPGGGQKVCTKKVCALSLAKGFSRAKFSAKLAFCRGEVWGEVFGEAFGLVLLGHSEQENFSKKLQPKIPTIPTALHSRIEKRELHGEVLQGTLAIFFGPYLTFANNGKLW